MGTNAFYEDVFITVGATSATPFIPGRLYNIKSTDVQSTDDAGTPGDTTDDTITYAVHSLPDDTVDGRETVVLLTVPEGGVALLNGNFINPFTDIVDNTGVEITEVGEKTSLIWNSARTAYEITNYIADEGVTSGSNTLFDNAGLF